MDFQDIKLRTINPDNIIRFSDGFYRFVNLTDNLVTCGFTTRKKLLSYSDTYRFDTVTVAVMSARYIKLIKNK
jgi:hypothetical protein